MKRKLINSINILGWLYGKFYTVWLWRDVIRGSLYYRHFQERFLYLYENRHHGKAGSRLTGTFFIYIIPRHDNFLYIRHNTHVQVLNKQTFGILKISLWVHSFEKSNGKKQQFRLGNDMLDDLISCLENFKALSHPWRRSLSYNIEISFYIETMVSKF